MLTEKEHLWASRKPSKRALQLAFYTGALTISERNGMLKTYELMARHFGWDTPPKAGFGAGSHRLSARPRAARARARQPRFDLPSRCAEQGGGPAPDRGQGAAASELVAVALEGAGKQEHWARPETLETPAAAAELVHILSPFDPLIIQRKRSELFFGYGHRFEAYVPKEKRLFGYFALPVLVGDEIVAAIDLKTDRREAQAAAAAMELGRQRGAARRAQGAEAPDRAGTAPVRAISARGLSLHPGTGGRGRR